MFDAFKSLTKAAIGLATLPVDVAADVITLGGTLSDSPVSYTVKKARKVMENLDDAVDRRR